MTAQDRVLLRDLAKMIAEVASRPEHEERKRLWYAQNSLRPPRPLIYISPEGSWQELLPASAMKCEDDDARGIEWGLRSRLYAAEHFSDDEVCEAVFNVGRSVRNTGWGLDVHYTRTDIERGSYVWDPPVKTRADVDKIQTPTATFDPDATQAAFDFYQELFGDILTVRLRGGFWWALGLIDEWTTLRGITQTFMDMTDDPELLHAGMRRLMEGKLAWLDQLQSLGVLSLNNENDYVGSGGFGWTDELPGPGFGGTVRLRDMWGFCEAQTMSEVSPAMHEEFVLRYQLPVLERFGLNCYGCCEPLHHKLAMLKGRVPRLRRISISPWADKRISAEALGRDYIFSWKPNPAYVAAVDFDAEVVRRDVRETLDIAAEHGCALEMILKDTHTCNQEPWRFDEWSKVAMEEVLRSVE